MAKEEWKTIPELNHLYSVSNSGKVKNNKTQRILKFRNVDGYLVKTFNLKNKVQYTSMHRLVLKNFNPISNSEKFHVHHIDYNTTNNHLDNLEWLRPNDNLIRKQTKEKSFQLYVRLRKKFGEDSLSKILNTLLNEKRDY